MIPAFHFSSSLKKKKAHNFYFNKTNIKSAFMAFFICRFQFQLVTH